MAVGNAIGGILTVTTTTPVDIVPSISTEEWVIHNIVTSGPAKISWTDGTNVIDIVSDSANPVVLIGVYFHVTQSLYLKVTNLDTADIYVGYDGVVVKA